MTAAARAWVVGALCVFVLACDGTSTVTVGCRVWKSLAIFVHSSLAGPAVLKLCHHVMVTGFLYRSLPDGVSGSLPLHAVVASNAVVATSARAALMRRGFAIGVSPRFVG